MRRFAVELHDVSASDLASAEGMLALVPAEWRAPVALLVVPDWMGRGRLPRRDAATAALRRLPGTRVLHGLTHSLGPSLVDRAWYGTENEAEFARLGAADAEARLSAAVEAFRDAFDETPRWFCAPRWQASAGARSTILASGLSLLERDAIVTPAGARLPSPALWFDDGARRLAGAIGSLQRVVRTRRALASEDRLRIALHPRDVRRAAARDGIRELFATLRRERWEPATLDALVAA